MSYKGYTSDTEESSFKKETLQILYKMIRRYPEVKELAQLLFLMGGETIIFDGWGNISDIENLIYYGKIIEVEDVSMEIPCSGEYECMQGFCWCNTAEVIADKPHFTPVYAFALSTFYPNTPFWMEHFILKNSRTGKYYEATDIKVIKKYYAMDISVEKLHDMESEYFDYDIDE